MTLAAITLLYPLGRYVAQSEYPRALEPCAACGVQWQPPRTRMLPVHPGCMLSDADRAVVLAAVDAGRRVDVLRRLRELGVNEKYGNAIVDAAIARRERALRDAERKGVA